MKKWIWTVIAIVVIGGGGLYIYKKSQPEPIKAQNLVATAQSGSLDVNVTGSGTVEPVTSTDITATDYKQIDEVLVKEGDVVKSGDELVSFTDGSDPITAPADGTITSLTAVNDERVQDGKVLAHLTNYKNLQTVIGVDELDIPSIKVGQSVKLTANAFPGTSFTGKVSKIAKEGNSENGVSTFDVTVHIDDPKNLLVGMSTEAHILINHKDKAIYVPIEAVYTSNNEKFVLLTDNSSDSESQPAAKQQLVKTGIHNDRYVEITEGLNAGQVVQLPSIASGASSNSENRRMGQGGFMNGGMSGMGGMNRMRGSSGGYSGGRRGN
ncbi:efflux RND transporter periplasmic adaptor subunit [Falsibacillus albus]|uniref:Efflux RND transporter periplasmic adaptor subunit n=1 Tax=Falsibacillus albus TaxID=2478915 RepID=A0A3L7JZA6_9BACI|nr:efflux RND transporter periplasmic adaptor subunit [Falsibacillus albus]RLQ96208.1 efflux RND transporter periplasmic adaptor subunit [Falsibacillus albus]